MVENRTPIAAPLPPRLSARRAGLSLFALGLLVSASGCASAVGDAGDEPESVGQTSQALGGIVSFLNTYTNGRIELGLQHALYNKGFFNVKYGLGGGAFSTTTNYNGLFAIDGAPAGAPYTFFARECDGAVYSPWSAQCSPWTQGYTAFVPYAGTTWASFPGCGADGLAGAYGVGSYLVDGVQTPLSLCSAFDGGSQYIGYFDGGACNYGASGLAYSAAAAQVLLTVPSGATWRPYSYGLVPHTALRAGWYNNAPLYACRTQLQGAYVPGWTYGDTCNVSWAGRFHAAPASASNVLSFAP